MAKRRDYRAESAARNARARAAGFRNYYEQRLARAQRAHPGISRAAARGHGNRAESQLKQLLRTIGRLDRDATVAFTGVDRQPDGTWRTARFDVINGGDHTYLIDGRALARLPEVADALAASGVMVLGAKYLEKMANQE